MSRRDSPLADRMVFLVGARRSGTNWLQRLLAVHPAIAALPSETHLFAHGIAPLAERIHHGAAKSPTTSFVFVDRDVFLDGVRDLSDAIFSDLARVIAPGARYILERTPLHVYHLDLIGDVYPDGRVINIIRDGRDVARSLLAHQWSTAPTTMADAAEEWRSAVSAAHAARSQLAHYYEIRYEQLLADPVTATATLLEWLDLEVPDDVRELVALEARSTFNVDPSMPSVGSGKWREGSTAADIEVFQTVAGETLETCGYETGPLPETRSSNQRAIPSLERVRRRVARGRARRSAPRNAAVASPIEPSAPVDDFLSAVHTGAWDRVRRVLTEDVWVEVVTADEQWGGRGADMVDHFIAVLSRDEPTRARQRRGDMHASPHVSTIVLSYEAIDGAQTDVTFVTWIQGSQLARVVYYRYPLSQTAPGLEPLEGADEQAQAAQR